MIYIYASKLEFFMFQNDIDINMFQNEIVSCSGDYFIMGSPNLNSFMSNYDMLVSMVNVSSGFEWSN